MALATEPHLMIHPGRGHRPPTEPHHHKITYAAVYRCHGHVVRRYLWSHLCHCRPTFMPAPTHTCMPHRPTDVCRTGQHMYAAPTHTFMPAQPNQSCRPVPTTCASTIHTLVPAQFTHLCQHNPHICVGLITRVPPQAHLHRPTTHALVPPHSRPTTHARPPNHTLVPAHNPHTCGAP